MPTRIVIVGGFLGAGKTTLLLHAAAALGERGYRVGLVTNDQGDGLVDTLLGREASLPVAEVAGGCFCCRFPDLLTGLEMLRTSVEPQIILAEPVGSCTDLVATVMRPLVRFYGDQYELAPLTVLLDSSTPLSDYPPSVRYLYQLQLAEAELILLSKSDRQTDEELTAQQTMRQAEFPRAQVIPLSARTGQGVVPWLDIVTGRASADPEPLTVDYALYAEAEATLGWLNAKGRVRADSTYSLHHWMERLLTAMGERCAQQEAPIAHIKLVTWAGDERLKAGLTGSSESISWDLGDGPVEETGHGFVLNARVTIAPALLEQIALQAIETARPEKSSRYYIERLSAFSPLPPEPTHRL